MLSEIIYNIYRLPISTVILYMLFLTPLFGIITALFKRRWPKQTQICCMILSTVYIMIILYLTVFKRQCGSRDAVELIPFSVFIRAKNQLELYREMVMNVFLFWPVGLLLPQGIEKLLQETVKCKSPVRTTIIIACLLSVTIEILQYVFSLGLVETDDVIANTIGTAVGTVSYIVSNKCLENWAKSSDCRED